MTSSTPEPSTASALLAAIARSLAGHPYMVIGGQAVLLYGDPRVTQDIDITVGLTPDQVNAILALTSPLGLRSLVDAPAEFVRDTFVLPLAHAATGLRVDVIFSWTEYEQAALKRTRTVRLEDTDVRFAAPEDVIVHKLFAGRPRDLEDVRGILSRRPALDIAYIRHWLGQLESASERSLLTTFAAVARDAGMPL